MKGLANLNPNGGESQVKSKGIRGLHPEQVNRLVEISDYVSRPSAEALADERAKKLQETDPARQEIEKEIFLLNTYLLDFIERGSGVLFHAGYLQIDELGNVSLMNWKWSHGIPQYPGIYSRLQLLSQLRKDLTALRR